MTPQLHHELRRLVEADAPEEYRGGVAVVLPVPPEDAEALALDSGLPASELHCTLAYLGDAGDLPAEGLKAVQAAVERWARRAPFNAKVGGIGRFAGASGEDDAVFLPVDVPRLPAERAELLQALEDAGVPASMAHGFTAHITLSYVPADEELPVDRVAPRAIRFSHVELWIGGQRVRYPLSLHTQESHMHAQTFRTLMEIVNTPAPRFEAQAPPPSTGGEHAGMKMVFGVWRKVGDMSHHDHTATGTKHAELHDKHLKKAIDHGTAMYAAQKNKNYEDAKRHGESVRAHHAIAIVHKDLARRHWKEGEDGEKDPNPVPEPNEATLRAARRLAQNVDTIHHQDHPDAFLTSSGRDRASQRTGQPWT